MVGQYELQQSFLDLTAPAEVKGVARLPHSGGFVNYKSRNAGKRMLLEVEERSSLGDLILLRPVFLVVMNCESFLASYTQHVPYVFFEMFVML